MISIIFITWICKLGIKRLNESVAYCISCSSVVLWFSSCSIYKMYISVILVLRLYHLGVTSKKKQYICGHCPYRREGGQPHVKKFKWNNFLTKVGEGGGHKNIVKSRSTLFCMIYNSIWPIQVFEGCLRLKKIHWRDSVSSCLYPWPSESNRDYWDCKFQSLKFHDFCQKF